MDLDFYENRGTRGLAYIPKTEWTERLGTDRPKSSSMDPLFVKEGWMSEVVYSWIIRFIPIDPLWSRSSLAILLRKILIEMKWIFGTILGPCLMWAGSEAKGFDDFQYLPSNLDSSLVFVGRTDTSEKGGAVLYVAEAYSEKFDDPFDPSTLRKDDVKYFDEYPLFLAELRSWPEGYENRIICLKGRVRRSDDWPVRIIAEEDWPLSEAELSVLKAIPVRSEREAEAARANFKLHGYEWTLVSD